MYEYSAKINRVIDGDTIVVDIDLGFKIQATKTLRLLGINTPEIYGKNASPEGTKVKEYVEALLFNQKLIVKTLKDRTGKYGRYLAEVEVLSGEDNGRPFWINLNKHLLENGMAEPYEG